MKKSNKKEKKPFWKDPWATQEDYNKIADWINEFKDEFSKKINGKTNNNRNG